MTRTMGIFASLAAARCAYKGLHCAGETCPGCGITFVDDSGDDWKKCRCGAPILSPQLAAAEPELCDACAGASS